MKTLQIKYHKIGLTLLICLQVGWALMAINNVYLADTLFVKSQKSSSLQEINQALNLNSNEPIYYRQRAKIYLSLSYTQNDSSLKEFAYKDMETSLNLNPKNMATIRALIPLYYFLAIQLNKDIDNNYIEKTKDYYRNAFNVAPTDVGVFVSLAKHQQKLGLTNDLSKTLEKIADLRPDLLQWHPDLQFNVSF